MRLAKDWPSSHGSHEKNILSPFPTVQVIDALMKASMIESVEVVLRHFHRNRYRSRSLWFFCGGRPLASWLLALGERGGHDDLRGSGRLSIIPTSTGELRCIVLKPALPEPFLFFDPLEVASTRPFYR
jgi:hypothetical protein